MITVVLNFKCSHKSRLDTLHKIFPNWMKVLKDYKFIINCDSPEHYESIKKLYETNVPDCDFSSDVESQWVDKTIEMVESSNTPYIYYLFEDADFSNIVTNEYFHKMFDEFHTSDAKHLMLGKTGKYSNPNLWKKTKFKELETIRTFDFNVPYDCCYPLAGIWDKELFLDVLRDVKSTYKGQSAMKQIDGCEKISNNYRDKKIKQACPLDEVTLHIQDVREAKR